MAAVRPELPPKIGRHYRIPWRRDDPSCIYVFSRYDYLIGNRRSSDEETREAKARYQRAKGAFDMNAAADTVNEVWNGEVIDPLIDVLLESGRTPLVVVPHPEYDPGVGEIIEGQPPTNALPFALAAALRLDLGCDVDWELSEIARPGRTKLDNFERFLWQPSFSGAVHPDCAYIIADDVCTSCGTLASLRSYIVEHGGTVVGAVALASRNGQHMQFPIVGRTLGVLRQCYGEELDEFWIQEIGHGPQCLTEAEGQRLAEWFHQNCGAEGPGSGALQRLRARIAQATANSRA